MCALLVAWTIGVDMALPCALMQWLCWLAIVWGCCVVSVLLDTLWYLYAGHTVASICGGGESASVHLQLTVCPNTVPVDQHFGSCRHLSCVHSITNSITGPILVRPDCLCLLRISSKQHTHSTNGLPHSLSLPYMSLAPFQY